MKQKYSFIAAVLVVIVCLPLFFQNCAQKGGGNNYASQGTTTSSVYPLGTTTTTIATSTTTTVAGSNPILIEVANNAGFSAQTTSFNYNETIFVRVKNLGSAGQGCSEVVGSSDGRCNLAIANNFTNLSAPDWIYNSASGEWSYSINSKNWHGRTVKLFFKRSSDSAINAVAITTQSIADATTSDVMVFYSSDPAGRQVIMDVKRNPSVTFYSHVKNGVNSADYLCHYVMTNPNGSSNPVDNCASSTPIGAGDTNWLLLPTETAADGNASMLSFVDQSANFHATAWKAYIYKGGVKHGPFYFTVKP